MYDDFYQTKKYLSAERVGKRMTKQIFCTMKFTKQDYMKIIRAVKAWPNSFGTAIPRVVMEMLKLDKAPDVPEEEYEKYRMRHYSTDSASQPAPAKAKACDDENNYADHDFENQYYGKVDGLGWTAQYNKEHDTLTNVVVPSKTTYDYERNEKKWVYITDEATLDKIKQLIKLIP